jgi:hypothetical protein
VAAAALQTQVVDRFLLKFLILRSMQSDTETQQAQLQATQQIFKSILEQQVEVAQELPADQVQLI